MSKLMLIDAAHPEETRVAIVNGGQVDDFDFETTGNEQLRGNIYLAKITRVEPSLQAAFVEYGGNRHGFLAFSEIHPDYYQLPAEDREALLKEAAEEAAAAIEDEDEDDDEGDNDAHAEAESDHDDDDASDDDESEEGDDDEEEDEAKASAKPARGRRPARKESPRSSISKRYKIQEVIRRRQVMLVQVVKEERGNKGAALTTYLSLAGRYCVLMPNTARGGGISRKIANVADRKKLKSAVKELEVPEGTGVIVRTAGAKRTKSEIKRDFEFLLRLWDDIRDLTLRSTAPTLVYEEASLITRAIRDFYSKDIDEVLVEGEDGYRVAKDFMKRIMPSHAKKVQPYRDRIPLFHRYQVEQQLDSMYGNEVTLPSGGYIVINSTEALVAIDVNSGKSTKGRSIEETATKTNLEAAEEVARQLRLRDLAGLVVIDFIDMDESRNNRSVERKLKDCLRVDRARIQIGRISHFGLLEMSRQRLRPGVQDVNMMPCAHCHGLGVVRSIDSTALHLLRSIEEEGIRERSAGIRIHMPADVAIYIVNHKRRALAEIEERYGFAVEIAADMTLVSPDHRIERIAASEISEEIERPQRETTAPAIEHDDDEDEADQTNARSDDDEDEAEQRSSDDDGGRPRSRRRRRRRGGASSDQDPNGDSSGQEATQGDDADGGKPEEAASGGDDDDDGEGRNRRRRGRRGGRRRRGRKDDDQSSSNQQNGGSDAAPLGDGEVNEEGIQSPFLMAAAVPPSQVQAEIVAEQSSPEDEPATDAAADQGSEDTGNSEAATAAADDDNAGQTDAAEETETGSDDTVEQSVSGDVAEASNDDAPEAPAAQAEEENQPADDDAVPEQAAEVETEAEVATEAEAEAEVEIAPETQVAAEAEPEPVVTASAEEPETAPAAEPEPELEPVADAAPKAPAKRGWWSRKRRDD